MVKSVTRAAARLLIGVGLTIIPFMARTWLARYRNVATNNEGTRGERNDKIKKKRGTLPDRGGSGDV